MNCSCWVGIYKFNIHPAAAHFYSFIDNILEKSITGIKRNISTSWNCSKVELSSGSESVGVHEYNSLFRD